MTRGFIRCLWGAGESYATEDFLKKIEQSDLPYDRIIKSMIRRDKIDKDISHCIREKLMEPFVTYVFGKDNFDYIKSLNLECELIDEDPYVYQNSRHKLEALKYAMQDFDEIVFMDWDTKPCKKMDENFWNILNKKGVIQSSLWHFRTPKINYRENYMDNKNIPAGAFIYIRDKTIPCKLIDAWSELGNKWSPEPSLAKVTDDMMGKWKDIYEYWKLYEPEVYHTKCSPYKRLDDYTKDKENIYFLNRGHSWRY